MTNQDLNNKFIRELKEMASLNVIPISTNPTLSNDEKREKPFFFKKQKLTYYTLKKFEKIKVYFDNNHDERSLRKDKNGNLYLYVFHEKINFFGNDEITEFFFLVENEDLANEYATKHISNLQTRFPFIHITCDYNIHIKEEIIG